MNSRIACVRWGRITQMCAALVSTASMAMVVAAAAPAVDNDAALKAETQKLVTAGLEAAAMNDWDTAAAHLDEASEVSSNMFVRHLSAVAATHREKPLEAFQYAKLSGLSGSPKNTEFSQQQTQIMEWARPAAIGRDEDCVYRPRDRMAQCPIERKGTLDQLVKKYFKEDYPSFWLRHDKAEAEAAMPCPHLTIMDKTGDPPSDTQNRCEARRVFHFYKFPPPPAIPLPAPDYQVPW